MAPRRVTIGSAESFFDRSEEPGRGARAGKRRRGDDTPFDGPWFRRGLLAVLAAALLALPLASLAIALFVDSDDVAAWLSPRLSGALNRQVTIGDAGIAILPRPGLRLSDVRVGDRGESDLPSIAAVRDVRLEASLLPLLIGRVNVGRVRLSGLDLHLAVSEDGASNFGDLVPEPEVVEVARRAPVTFAVEEVSIEDASLTYFDAPGDRSLAIGGASASLGITVDPEGGWTVVADAEGDSLHVRVPALTDEIVRGDAPNIALTVRGDRGLERIEVEEGTIEQWGETLAVSGSIEGLADVDPVLDLHFDNPALDAGAFAALVPSDVRASRLPALEGTLDLRLRLRGSLRGEGSPVLVGTVGLTRIGVRLGGASLVSGVGGGLVVRPDTIRVDSVVGTFADGPFELSAKVSRDTRHVLASFGGSPDLDAFARLGLAPLGSTLAGEAALALEITGPLGAPDSLGVTGSVRLSGLQAEHERLGVPLYVPSADLVLGEADVRWSELSVLVGDDPLTTSGAARGPLAAWWLGDAVPDVEASLTGPRLDLEAVLPPEGDEPDVTYARIAFAHLGGREIDGRPVRELIERAGFSRPEDLPLRGSIDVSVDELGYRSHELREVSARLVFSDSSLTVEEAAFDAWDGSVRGRLELGTGPGMDQPFALELGTEDVDAAAFLSRMSPVGDAVRGRLDLDFAIAGVADPSAMPLLSALDGRGALTVRDGVVEGTGLNLALADFLGMDDWTSVPFITWETGFTVDGGVLDVSESRITGDFARVTLSGIVGLDGAVDLAMALSIPPDQLQAVSLRRTGVAETVLDRLREAGSSLDLGIRVSGTLAGPTLEPDALAASERLAASGR